MTKYRNPVMLDSVQPTKASRLQLENLYAALVHLVNIEGSSCSQELLTVMGMVYNRMLFLYAIGGPEFISEIKLVRRWLIDFFRGSRFNLEDLDISRYDEEAGCPVLLSGFEKAYNKVLEGHDEDALLFFQRVMYSLLCADRVIVLPQSPNYASISKLLGEGVLTSKLYPTDLEITNALAMLGITSEDFKSRYAIYCKGFEYEILSGAGPNGPQTWSAHLDARAWAMATGLFPRFRNFLEESKLVRILKDLIGCIKIDSKEIQPLARPRLGKLAVISEWGGKTRIVAELDYWTQMALTPLHHTINYFVRKLGQDGTFDQGSVARQVQAWTADPVVQVYSYDLTAATDRLPIKLQQRILSILLGSNGLASNWADILTDRWYLRPDGELIAYGAGQPMGARSSFPMLALTHHVIVMIAAQRAKISNYSDYVILGDDSTLTGLEVAAHYKALIEALGVEINLSKSITYSAVALGCGEICKRVFLQGNEISVFNSKEIVKTIKDGRLGPTLQNDLLERGWRPSAPNFWLFMAAVLDRENLATLMKLNLVPQEISGLHTIVKPSTPLVDLKLWYKGVPLSEDDLIQLHTFVMATDQLKRLDSVLRASSTLTDVLGILAASLENPKAIPISVRNTWLNEILSEEGRKVMNTFLDTLGPVSYNHPILSAARAETNRISELLHSLNSYDVDMVKSTRRSLLEACRSAVGTIWMQESGNASQTMRAVFTRMLTTLTQIVVRGRASNNEVKTYSINYSVTLTTIGRLWNVHFAIGSQTTINALHASVSRNIIEASKGLDEVITSLGFDPTPSDTITPITKDSKYSSQKGPKESIS